MIGAALVPHQLDDFTQQGASAFGGTRSNYEKTDQAV
jgi:hypothetical protein